MSNSYVSYSQNKILEKKTESWLAINVSTNINKRIGINSELHLRKNNFFASPALDIYRLSGFYYLNDSTYISTGISKCITYQKGRTFEEFRIHQQFQIIYLLGRLGFISRLTNELRWKENETSLEVLYRIRYLMGVNIPISKKVDIPFFTANTEVFCQFGNSITNNIFDQIRIYAGFKENLTKSISMNFGYMYIIQQKIANTTFDNIDVLKLAISYQLKK